MRTLLFLLSAVFLFCSGCHRYQKSTHTMQASPSDMYESDGDYDDPRMQFGRERSAEAKSARPSRSSVGGTVPPKPSPSVTPPPTAKPSRMIHYSGYARIRVARTEEGIDAITALTDKWKGLIERVSTKTVTIRVPVEHFEDAFEELLGLGDVLDKNISAQDVTDAYTAVSLRLDTARATRDRLIVLLAKARDEQEKLVLVREIQRLSESIDKMESQSRTLSRLASLARITIELVPREALAWQDAGDEAIEFAWIRYLNPFHDDVIANARPLMLDVPEGLVALDVKRKYIAESADGTRIWSGRMENAPLADGKFWVDAIKQRLEKDFASAEVTTIGSFHVLTFTERADKPYTWMIALQPDGKHLSIVEVYYPDAAQQERYEGAVKTVIEGASGGAS